MSGVLIDTHMFLFLMSESDRVPADVRRAIDDAEHRFFSVASVWEMSIKTAIGKLRLPEPLNRFVPSRMSAMLVRSLPITEAHAIRVASLAPIHRDPFDRLLVAQALEESLTIVTLDPQIARYGVATVGVKTRKKKR